MVKPLFTLPDETKGHDVSLCWDVTAGHWIWEFRAPFSGTLFTGRAENGHIEWLLSELGLPQGVPLDAITHMSNTV